MMDVNDHGSLPWGSNTLSSEKPILHYITHTEDSLEQPRLEGARTGHVRNGEIPASYPEISRIPATPRTCTECAGITTQFPTSRMPAAPQRGMLGRGRSRPGKVRRHWRRGGRSSPVPRICHAHHPVPSPSRRAARGPPAPLPPDDAGRRIASLHLLGTFGGPPLQNYTTFREILHFPSRHRRARIRREGPN